MSNIRVSYEVTKSRIFNFANFWTNEQLFANFWTNEQLFIESSRTFEQTNSCSLKFENFWTSEQLLINNSRTFEQTNNCSLKVRELLNKWTVELLNWVNKWTNEQFSFKETWTFEQMNRHFSVRCPALDHALYACKVRPFQTEI